jgi:hypothetical protein
VCDIKRKTGKGLYLIQDKRTNKISGAVKLLLDTGYKDLVLDGN